MNAQINRSVSKKLFYIVSLFTSLLLLTACTTSVNIESTPLSEISSDSIQKVGCNFSDLTGYVHAENNFNAIQGLIVLSNYTENQCLIDSIWEVAIVDSNNEIIVSTTFDLLNNRIDSDHFLSIDFIWKNYCQQISPESFELRIVENKNQQTILIPIEDPNGNLISTTPACKDQNQKQSFLLQISQ